MSLKAAAACENAKGPRCRCRCGGALHGKGYHTRTTAEIVAQLEEMEAQLTDKARAALARLREAVAVQEMWF